MALQSHSSENKEESDEEVPFFPNVLLAEVSLALAVVGPLLEPPIVRRFRVRRNSPILGIDDLWLPFTWTGRDLCKQPLHHSRFLDESDRVRFDCVCAYCESANYQRCRSMTIRIGRLPHFLLWIAAFVVSIYAVSNLMPLLLHVATRGLSFADGLPIIGYLLTIAASMLILARGIYRLDRRGGRIRNKVGWFE